nr:MAG TPA: hypothetical protein [Caudoviricetes sp.]
MGFIPLSLLRRYVLTVKYATFTVPYAASTSSLPQLRGSSPPQGVKFGAAGDYPINSK